MNELKRTYATPTCATTTAHTSSLIPNTPGGTHSVMLHTCAITSSLPCRTRKALIVLCAPYFRRRMVVGQEKGVWFAEMAAFCDSTYYLVLKAKQLPSIEKY